MDDDVDDDDDEDDGGESPLVGNFLNLCFSIFVPKFVPIFSKNIFLSQNLDVCMSNCQLIVITWFQCVKKLLWVPMGSQTRHLWPK